MGSWVSGWVSNSICSCTWNNDYIMIHNNVGVVIWLRGFIIVYVGNTMDEEGIYL